MEGPETPLSNLINHDFDLLSLQEDEYYFRDYSCTFIDGDNTPLAATLKLCSCSLYLVPHGLENPVVRVPFEAVTSITTPSQEKEEEEGSEEETYISADSTDSSVILIESSSLIYIERGSQAAPYITSVGDPFHDLTLILPDGNTATVLGDIKELEGIAKLRAGGKEGERAGAEKLQTLITAHEAAVPFDISALPEQEQDAVLLQLRGLKISPLLVQPGWIVLSQNCLCFQPYHSPTAASSQVLKLDAATRVGRRKFQLKDVALEVFFDLRSSIFLAFASTKDRNAFETALSEQTVAAFPPPPVLRDLTKEWAAGKLSNFEYISELNEAAGRSFNDFTQYPVFPWVLQDYVSSTLDLTDPAVFRDLSRPIAALNPARVQHGREMYAVLRSSGGSDPPWMYGSHYSNPGLVVFYLLRRCPQLMLRLQNGRLDAPDRLFCSIASAWDSVLRWNSDVKELIPEFYRPGGSAFLVNSTGADLGKRSDGVPVGDVELPPWADSPEDFLEKMSAALEAPLVSNRLHKWIDLVFGVKQKGAAAVQNDNVFHFMTDDDTALRYMEREKDGALRSAFEAQVREYGRTPKQLFIRKHPKRKTASKMAGLLQACACGPVAAAPPAGKRNRNPSNKTKTA